MVTDSKNNTNAKKVAQLQQAMAEMLTDALRRGYFGTLGLEFAVQDGTIQHIRRRVERLER